MTKLVESGDDATTTHLKSYENVINPLTPVSSSTANGIMQCVKMPQTTTVTTNFNSSSSTSTASSGGVGGAGAGSGGPGDGMCADNSSSSNNSMYKARQLSTKGPQDFLYISTTTTACSGSAESANEPVDNSIAVTSNSLIQTSRICSKSYTKIPEVVASQTTTCNVETATVKTKPTQQTAQPVANVTTRAKAQRCSSKKLSSGSNSNSNQQLDVTNSSMHMSRSVIVTASEATTNGKAYSFNRMTVSSMSRHNSK